MENTVAITCPYCWQRIEITLDPDTRGQLVQDCEVCCRPWLLVVRWKKSGEPVVRVERAQ